MHVCARSGSEFLDPSSVTQYEVQVGHRYTVHVCARLGVPCLIGSELLDPSTATQCEVQVGHRQPVHVCARNGCILARCVRSVGSELLDLSTHAQVVVHGCNVKK